MAGLIPAIVISGAPYSLAEDVSEFQIHALRACASK
jgi:hypothetical protein